MTRARTLFVGCLALAGISAHAQAVPAANVVQTYLDSPDKQAATHRVVEESLRAIAPNCQSIEGGQGRTVIYRPLEFGRGPEPIAGMFREIVPVVACGEALQFNILAIARANGPVQRIALLNGTTVGDPVLQRDAVRYALDGAASRVPAGCTTATIRTTRFLGYDKANLAGKRPWREIWTISACKEQIPVEMQFQPDADGTTVISRIHTR